MATLLFAVAGQAAGAAIGGNILGVAAASLGQAVGAQIGRAIDQKLLGGSCPIKQEGPRLDNLEVMTSQEGAPLADISGRAAISGEVIWAAKLKENATVTTQKVGSGKNKQKVQNKNYDYTASLAISLGEGVLANYGRVWANDKLVDLSDMINEGRLRFYTGSETQELDPLIASIEGGAPAFRGTAYIVFEDLPLEEWGNAIPQIKVEVFGQSGEMERLVRGVNLIPGSTEWGYLPRVMNKEARDGAGNITYQEPDNANRFSGVSDWKISLDHMGAMLPEAETVSLVVAWFGTDLRAGQCEIEPRLELREKTTDVPWTASGLTRASANLVSTAPNGRPSYGSAPADVSVIEAIQDLKARGKRVVLYPFVMMDVTEAQALPHPSGTGTQGAYPWRGRITPETGNDTSDEVGAFMGTAAPSDFAVDGSAVSYSGPNEWRFRRFILHLAHLAKAAGGVDAFLIGSEMRGLSMAPETPGDYPFVSALKSLAADVRTVLPAAKISYAADWSEYHSHQVNGDLRFHLDPLWADSNIDFVGIDNYLPLSDWRPGIDHADYDNAKGHTSPYSLDYLKGNIEGGEYWDWFYSSDADREAQVRTPITDGAHNEPWVFRQKAIRDWQANAHHERVGGTRQASATAWTPGSKPIWFTELGCPAVDFGSNRPNVFSAANSSEGALPWFSQGIRDDFMQRQFLRASLEWWRDNGGAVVAPDDIQIWCWDARPWPEFPMHKSVWSDVPDWYLGHWLNGRAGAAPAAEAITRRLTQRHGLTAGDLELSACYGQADGYPATAPIGFRDYLQPFEIGLGLQSHEADGRLVIESRGAAVTGPDTLESVMVDVDNASPFTAKRGAIEDVSATAIMRFVNGLGDYQRVGTRAIIGAGNEQGASQAELPLVMDFDRGTAAVEQLVRSASAGREVITFRLPRSATHVRPGIILPVKIGQEDARPMIVERVVEGTDLTVEAKSYSHGSYAPTGGVFRPVTALAVRGSSAILVHILDLPILPGSSAEVWDSVIAVHSDPWPGTIAFAKSATDTSGFAQSGEAPVRSAIGEITSDLPPLGCLGLWQMASVDVKLNSGTLVTRDDIDVLNGLNAMAVRHADGWEVLQFRESQLIGTRQWRLSGLLRGQLGTDIIPATSALAAGAPVVVLDAALQPLGLEMSEIGTPRFHRVGPSKTDVATHGIRAHTGAAVGRRPYAPCHLKVMQSGGNYGLTWIRRTREDGEADWRDGITDVPIGEVTERYTVEVVKDGVVKRQAEVTSSTMTYQAADVSADGVTKPFTVRVAQISESFGPGGWAKIEIT
ncbi:baseplate multidomain protein megatron [Falsiruegeria litorea]|uniref:baseplate multidomain protein megatron n=1 Tax=Falsiruegeria litorea TaxID=1280831 RepID=UPI001BFE9906|nr:glycoside hydrolase/phage tail family protein [Falsiruegeria litorea]MBT8169869.1 glycoside hydrolase/phage tail family protein [Falsiruegeria litorea]